MTFSSVNSILGIYKQKERQMINNIYVEVDPMNTNNPRLREKTQEGSRLVGDIRFDLNGDFEIFKEGSKVALSPMQKVAINVLIDEAYS